jgi:hypothetical protein
MAEAAAAENHAHINDPHKNWYDFIQVVITELNETSLNETSTSGEKNDSTSVQSDTQASSETASTHSDRFYIEEPYDYVFEPDHYPKSDKSSEQSSMEHESSSSLPSEETSGVQPTPAAAVADLNEVKNENKFTYATVVGENNGYLEYEYKHYTYKRNLYTNKTSSGGNFDHDYHLLSDYSTDNHLNAFVRGVSLSKWPHVGFGFSVAMQKFGNDTIYFVCDVKSDSPAEFGLRLGDILVELDDISTNSIEGGTGDVGFQSVESINAHLERVTSVHLVVIHESKYHHFAKSKLDYLRNCNMNCEDFVVVSHSR